MDSDPDERTSARDVALRRGTTAAALLRRAANIARQDTLPVSSLPGFLRPKGVVTAASGGLYGVFVRLSFLAVFVIPSVLATLYFLFIASDQYTTEVRFALRNAEKSSLERADPTAGLASMLGNVSQAQDTLIVTNFVRSRPLVSMLDTELNLRSMFSSDKADFLSAIDPSTTIEGLVRYWQDQVKVGLEAMSGLVTIQIRAYTPEDALAIAKAVTQHSEALVNSLSERSSSDLLRDTEAEMQRAEAKLKETRAAMQDLRNKQGTLDPDISATGYSELLAQLRQARAEAAAELATLSASLSPNAPQLKPIRARIAAIDAQIAQLETELTGSTTDQPDGDLSASMTEYDQLNLENQVAERRYAAAVAALEAARLAADRHKVYLNSFVEPSLPQEASWPPRRWFIVGSVLGAFTAWIVLIGSIGLIRRRMA